MDNVAYEVPKLTEMYEELRWKKYITEQSYQRLLKIYNNLNDPLIKLKLENILNLLEDV